ncbi:hypothetical protein CRUP_017523, partial [Coryphaenoides rupestris]
RLVGNLDSEAVVQNKLSHSIRTRFLRLLPLDWNPSGWVGLRVEVYGCAYKSYVADFDGRSSLHYHFNQKSMSTVKDVVSLRFKSWQAEGVLVHGEGQRGNYITLELHRSRLALYLNLDERDGGTQSRSIGGRVAVTLGSLLDDQHWHSVHIERHRKQVNLTVDGHTQHFRTQGDGDSLEVDQELSFGGIPLPGKHGTFLRKNFHGCIENLYYNGINIIDLAKRRKPQIDSVALQVALILDNNPASTIELGEHLDAVDYFYFGGCPPSTDASRCENPTAAFQGCMRLVFINGRPVNLHHVQQAKEFKYTGEEELCLPNHCEHGGRCSQTWSSFDCDCSGTGHSGPPATTVSAVNEKFSSFVSGDSESASSMSARDDLSPPLYEPSCEAYKLTGSSSGYYSIDPDGSGPLGPTRVYCNMTEDKVWTVLDHSSSAPVRVQGSSPQKPYVMKFNYSASPEQLRAIVTAAEQCQQEVVYRCRKSRLFNGWDGAPLAWWLDQAGERRTYWAGSLPGIRQCSCGLQENCQDMNYFCNCDTNVNMWSNDTGLLSYKEHLPVSQIVIGDTNQTGSEAVYQVGALHCYGDKSMWNAASFYQDSSYLRFLNLQAELGSDISFYFKTSAPSGVFLENLGLKDFIRVELSYGAPLAWWLDQAGERRTYWAGSLPGIRQCSCGLQENCQDMNYFCNCDTNVNMWSNDTGLLSYKEHLPVSQIVIGDTNQTGSEAVYQVGALQCYGDKSMWNAASFYQDSSYLRFLNLQAELGSDISFYFKTSAPSGVFLENLGLKDFIRVELSSPSAVAFSFNVGNGPVVLSVKSHVPLNDRQWHYVRAERNVREASLQVDQLPLRFLEAPADGHLRLRLNSDLFVGGTASRQRGFLGCIRTLAVNGVNFNLDERARMTPGVSSGCPGYCSSSSSLCHNRGRCIEKSSGFVCDCSQSAYGGPSCREAPSAVAFSFNVGNGPVVLSVKSHVPLNDRQWHYVRAERNVREASLQVDQLPLRFLEAPADGHLRLRLNSQLFVGGTASRQRGFLGCIRTLAVNGVNFNLDERARMTPGVSSGCPGYCSGSSSLCHNRGRCIEKSSGFVCDCSQSAYGGPSCREEVSVSFDSKSSVTYTFQETFSVMQNLSSQASSVSRESSRARENVAFSFLTSQRPAMLLSVSTFSQQYIAVILATNGRPLPPAANTL